MKYLNKVHTNSSSRINYPQPNICPYCNTAIDARVEIKSVGHEYWAAFFQCTLAECQKWFLCLYQERRRMDSNSFDLMPLFLYPRMTQSGVSPEITELSPQFVKLYGQAEDAEASNSFELAACGYRNAVEALVKDYAVKYKNVAADDNLTKKTLQNCINDYLDGLDESIAAYMVKEFGNAATHYPLCDAEFDFAEQKVYLELFLQYITGKLKILKIKDSLPQKRIQKFEKPGQQVPAPASSD